MIAKQWRRAWAEVIPFFAFPPEIRRMIYTTNALENVNRQMRKAIKTRGHFPNDDAAITLVWLGPTQRHEGVDETEHPLASRHDAVRHSVRGSICWNPDVE